MIQNDSKIQNDSMVAKGEGERGRMPSRGEIGRHRVQGLPCLKFVITDVNTY